MLKFSRSDELSARLPRIVSLIDQLWDQRDYALALLTTALRYLAAVAQGLDEATVRQALTAALPVNMEKTIMATLAEIWLERGREEGK